MLVLIGVIFLLLLLKAESLLMMSSNSKSITKSRMQMNLNTDSSPLSFQSLRRGVKLLDLATKATLFSAAMCLGGDKKKLTALAISSSPDGEEKYYYDTVSDFSLLIPSGWTNMPRKAPTSSTMSEFQGEEVQLVASSFVEGASLSITKTNPSRLLKDFDIDWWFAPLNSFGDMGTPLLVAELLVLQRQGDFLKRQTPSEIKNAVFKENDSVLEFEFSTPLAEEVNRKSLVKACFVPNKGLQVIWVSALSGVWQGDYADKLASIRDSFAIGKRSA